MDKYNILVCDDDKAIVDALEIYLKQENYNVIKAYTGKQALKILEEQKIHLILLDIMMPEMDGLTATVRIREELNIPIIILSAKSEDTDKIIGLNFGADDYVTKPFNPLELLARVKSQLRRYTLLGGAEQKKGILKTGGLELDTEAKELRLDGEKVKLTATEYGIVLFLMKNMGKVFSIEQIYQNVWNEPLYTSENTVAVHIRRIREKIEINPKEPKYLKVVWGIGYKIEKY
ncbi:response regulator transcription factor [Acetivibrio clariflavus]|uniref:Stage 0 sporulation protein A homolog n=1 Tax=Acetivibrio clariflavus (strain DSM 19732 / NBRC 101661 / EBR45) TaxID=720554 RepID=G8LXE4_ACECE|nr:response regulator transcription factor [Acetivibrio clariflavus]AEV69862.1 response regulator with CheY-like receiver domain and winged-helix DNA-binding domain [Acetivibrio clariflavus DSM 19732]HPU42382.1 response regulator transcription factor [Acetivibrio clariflavus]